MRIITHHHVNGELQRSLVEAGSTYFIRVHARFNMFLGSLVAASGSPEWFRTPLANPLGMADLTGLDDTEAAALEMDFVTELIRLNAPVAPPLPTPAVLECEACGCKGGDVTETTCPYCADVFNDPNVPATLCGNCYKQRCDDI